jgi:hypothetical protein
MLCYQTLLLLRVYDDGDRRIVDELNTDISARRQQLQRRHSCRRRRHHRLAVAVVTYHDTIQVSIIRSQ